MGKRYYMSHYEMLRLVAFAGRRYYVLMLVAFTGKMYNVLSPVVFVGDDSRYLGGRCSQAKCNRFKALRKMIALKKRGRKCFGL